MVTRGRTALPLFAGATALAALLEIGVLWTGAAGLVLSRGLAGGIVAASVVLAVLFGARFRGRDEGETVVERSGAGAGSRIPARIVAAAALLWTGWLWARLWLLAWRRPPSDWDGLYYHLPAIDGWALAGRVRWLASPPDIPFVDFPMGVEANTFLMTRLHGAAELLNACNLWYWPLAVLALVVLAGRIGARGAWAWLAGGLLCAAPVVVCQSASCYIDPGFAAATMAAMAATLLLVHPPSGAGRLETAVLWGAALGLMAGAKGTGVPFAVIVVLVAAGGIVARWWYRDPAGDPDDDDGLLVRLRPLAVGGAVALAVGGYWFLRNSLMGGNPVYPVQVALGGKVIFPGYDHVAFSEANLPDWLAAWPGPLRMLVSWLELDAPIQGYAPVGGLGYLWPAACVPAVVVLAIVLWRRRGDPGAGPFLLLVATTGLFILAQPAAWWSRFTIWLLGLGLPALAALLSRAHAAARGRLARLAVVACAAGCLGLAAWESGRTLRLEEAYGRDPDAAAGAVAYLPSQEMIVPGMWDLPGMDEVLAEPRLARSPWGRMGTLLAGCLAQPPGRRELIVLSPEPTPDDLARLRADGVRWILWDVEGGGEVPPAVREAADEAIVYHPDAGSDFRFLRLRD